MPVEILELFSIRRGPGDVAWEGLFNSRFQSGTQEIPYSNRPAPPPPTLFSSKPKPHEKVLRSVAVNRKHSCRACSHHCFSGECLEAMSWFWLHTLFVVKKLFCPDACPVSSNFLDPDSCTFSRVFFLL